MTEGERLTPALLRMHAGANRSTAWEGQARHLLRWAADALEAAEEALRPVPKVVTPPSRGQASRLNVRKAGHPSAPSAIEERDGWG